MRAILQVVKKLMLAFAAVVACAAAFKLALLPAIVYLLGLDVAIVGTVRGPGIALSAVLGYFAYVKLYEKRAAPELSVKPIALLGGAASGAVLIGLAMLPLFACGVYAVLAYRGFHDGLFGVAATILIAALLEEIVFRAVLFRILDEAWGLATALWLSALIFAVSHLGNFEAGTATSTLLTTVVSATLISAFWALIFARWRNLWLITLHHAAWNFSIVLSGAPLSGLEEWRTLAPIELQYRGPDWLTGGIFGPEDSVITLAMMAIGVCVLLYLPPRDAPRAMAKDASRSVAQSASRRRAVSPLRVAQALDEHWSPRVIAEVDDCFVKVAKVQGTFGWHSHADEDELFFILKGALQIETQGAALHLAEGELAVVPKGVRHNPSAADECLLLLIERKSTLHAGTDANDKARSLEQQLRPL